MVVLCITHHFILVEPVLNIHHHYFVKGLAEPDDTWSLKACLALWAFRNLFPRNGIQWMIGVEKREWFARFNVFRSLCYSWEEGVFVVASFDP